MKKVRVRRPFFYLLFAFFLTIMAGLAVSSAVTYGQYKKQIVRSSSEKSVQMLSQTSYAVGFVWDWASTYAYQLYRDGDIFNYIYSTDITQMDEFSISQKQLLLNPLVKSIYFYNGNLQRVFSTQSQPTSVRNFCDQGVFDILRDKDKIGNLNFIPRKCRSVVDGTTSQYDCLSIVMPPAQEMNFPLEGAVVVNLNASVVLDTIRSVNPFEGDRFAVLDGDGTIIADSQSDSFLKNVSEEAYVKHLKKDSGYFLIAVNGKEQLVSFVYSRKLDWYFVEFIPYENIVSQTYGMRNLIIFLNLLVFILFAFFALLLSHRYYFPVVKLADNVYHKTEKIIANKKGAAVDEVDYLSDMVNSILSQYRELSNQSRGNVTLVRNERLRGILTGSRPWNDAMLHKFEEMGIRLNSQRLMLLLLRIDNYRKTINRLWSQTDQELLRFALANIANELVGTRFPNETADMGSDTVALILDPGPGPEKVVQKELLAFLREIQAAAAKHLEFTVSGTISSVVEKIDELPKVFAATTNLSNCRLIYGKECAVTPEMNPDLNFHIYEYPQETEYRILENLRLRKEEEVKEQSAVFFADIRLFTYDEIMISVSTLVYASVRVLNDINYVGDISHRLNFSLIRPEYERFDTLKEIESWLLSFYGVEIRKLPEDLSRHKGEYVEGAMKIIDAQYSDANMTVESIAGKLGLSSNYLRKLFKELKGISLSEYLSDYRMEKAKEWLAESNISVGEVCARVGIPNENYFYTSFKKRSGFTPGQFRERFCQSEKPSSFLP